MTGIYDAIGGAEAITAVVDEFYRRLLADPDLAPFFADIDFGRLKTHQRAFIAAAVGGSAIYAGRDMAAAHAGLSIRTGHFDAVVGHLVDTLAALGVPDATIAAIGLRLGPLRADIITTAEPTTRAG